MDAKSSRSRRFYYSMSLASRSVPVLQRILDVLPPPRPNLPANMNPPSPSNFPLSGVCIIFFNWYHFFLGGGGINPRRIVFPPDKWVAWLAKLFCQSHKSRKTSPLPRSLGKDPSEWWEWSLATLLSTLCAVLFQTFNGNKTCLEFER